MIKSYLASALFMVLGVLFTGIVLDTIIVVFNFLIKEGVL